MRGPAPPLHMMRGARRAVLGHRVHPSARDGIERIWRDGSFWHGCQRRKPRSERVQEEQCSFVGIGGRLVNVPVKTSMTTMLVNATLPSRESVDISAVHCWIHCSHTKVARRNVRICECLECTNECRGTKQWRSEFESSGWMITSASWTDRSL